MMVHVQFCCCPRMCALGLFKNIKSLILHQQCGCPHSIAYREQEYKRGRKIQTWRMPRFYRFFCYKSMILHFEICWIKCVTIHEYIIFILIFNHIRITFFTLISDKLICNIKTISILQLNLLQKKNQDQKMVLRSLNIQMKILYSWIITYYIQHISYWTMIV